MLKNIHITLKSTKTFSILIIVNCLLIIDSSAADFDFTPNLQRAYSEIFKLRIQSGRDLLAKESSTNPFRIYIENYAEMVELIKTNDTEHIKRINQLKKQSS